MATFWNQRFEAGVKISKVILEIIEIPICSRIILRARSSTGRAQQPLMFRLEVRFLPRPPAPLTSLRLESKIWS